MYYFTYKDSILKYAPEQIDTIKATLYDYQEWKYLTREDHYLDALYPGGKEFNSENFHWMLRTTGHLFSHEFHSEDERNNHLLSFTDVNGVERTNIDIINYFDGFLNNLTRSLYSSGRVEWNSFNYWAHTVNPLLSLYQGADKCNNPLGEKAKKQAKACLDWMMVEAALHYLDGYHIAADARAKSVYVNNKPGGIGVYTYAFFTDEENHPSFGTDYWDTHSPGTHESGFLLSTDYRPPQVIRDIAQRKFQLPVEIQSAKPFYHVDFGDYLGMGQPPYYNWKGDNEKSRRFEFETIYMGENFLMSSIAGGRPDGGQGTYSEQAQWEIGVKGNDNGALQITGNAGYAGQTPAGRWPYHEIGQYRNMMVHLTKSPSTNQFFILIPDANDNIAPSGSGTNYEWNGNDLFVDMGNDVYIAFISYAATGHSVNNSTSLGDNHTQVTWNFTANQLGGIIIEVGTASDYTSFVDFVSALNFPAITAVDDTTIEYESVIGNTIKMVYTSPIDYYMVEGTEDTPASNPVTGGNYPKVWGDGEYIDYLTWDSYKTVYGTPIVNQEWGSGVMDLSNGTKMARIKVDLKTSEVSYFIKDESNPPYRPDYYYTNPGSFENSSFLDSSYTVISVDWDIDNDGVYDVEGESINYGFSSSGDKRVSMKISTDNNCYYQASKTVYVDLGNIIMGNKESSIYVSPNPTTDFIQFIGLRDDAEVFIFSGEGKIVLNQRINRSSGKISVKDLIPGIYYVQLFSDKESLGIKLLKQ
jgi:hypothetical protein